LVSALLKLGATLTPAERMTAMRKLGGHNPFVSREFIICGLIAIALLLILLVIVHYGQKWKQKKVVHKEFLEFANRNGLSESEQLLLELVGEKAGVKSLETIFTMPAAFDKGVNNLLVEESAMGDERRQKEIQDVLISLRSKLGFVAGLTAAVPVKKGQNASSRQISKGKKVHLTRRREPQMDKIEAEVVDNGELEFSVKMPKILQARPGEVWILQYNYGPAVWEFDATLIRASNDVFVFGHSEGVRFISRRRFVRVAVNTKAYFARFPFDTGRELSVPEFMPCKLRELAGPGLLLQTHVELRIGERILVVLELPEEKVVEDMGEVKHVRTIEGGYSVAVELTGVKEAQVDELIKATNAAMAADKAMETEMAQS
jgi:hypothetical protein